MTTFRLVLALHAPVIMPVVAPRLDTLLLEGMRRLTQDWSSDHALPLVFDETLGGYRASQLVFAPTPDQPLAAVTAGLSTRMLQSDLTLASKVPRRLRQDGGVDAQRLTRHEAIRSPYAYFYAEGDPEECLRRLAVIRAVGRETKRHFGAFSVEGVEQVSTQQWALRSWPARQKAHAEALAGGTWINDALQLQRGGETHAVVRPPRVIREMRDV